jgi:hypothetical protein
MAKRKETAPLHYKIYKCYEIVILDNDGNQVGETEYCYGNRETAEQWASESLETALRDLTE